MGLFTPVQEPPAVCELDIYQVSFVLSENVYKRGCGSVEVQAAKTERTVQHCDESLTCPRVNTSGAEIEARCGPGDLSQSSAKKG